MKLVQISWRVHENINVIGMNESPSTEREELPHVRRVNAELPFKNPLVLDCNFLGHRRNDPSNSLSLWSGSDIKALEMDIDGIPDDVLAAFVGKVVDHQYHQMSAPAI